MKYADRAAMILLFLAGLNWGLIAVFDFNLVDYVFGQTWIDTVLYFLMGASAIYIAVNLKSVIGRARSKG
jgi:hypothetical protein